MISLRCRLYRLWLAPIGLVACSQIADLPVARIPARLLVISQATRTALAGSDLREPIIVELLDASNRPVPGQPVSFRVASGNGQVTPGAAVTNASGQASARWTLGTSSVERQQLEVKASELASTPLTAQIDAVALPGAPVRLTVVGSDVLQGELGATLPEPVSVHVSDRFGNPVSGIEVQWTVASGAGSVNPPRSVSDSAGTARTRWTLGNKVDASQELDAAANALPPLRFRSQARMPTNLAILQSGSDQVAEVGSAPSEPLIVLVQLADGRPVAGLSVTWTVRTGAGSLTTANAVTDSSGKASARWTLGLGAGEQSAAANVAGLREAMFRARATAGPAAAVSISPADGRLNVGAALQLFAAVSDRFGNVLSGRAVTWTTSDPNTAAVTPTGLVTGRAGGTATITAASEGQSAQLALTVLRPTVSTITIEPSSPTMQVGQTLQLRATLFNSAGETISSPLVTWSSSSPATARVDNSGMVSAIASGQTTVKATSDGASATTQIAVVSVPSPPPPPPPPPQGVPASPLGLSASAASTSQINLQWQDNSGNEDRFELETRATPGAQWSPLATVSANTTTYAHSGLSAGSQHYYRVRACNNAGCSAYSNEAQAATDSVGSGAAPTVTTEAWSISSTSSVAMRGTVNANGSETQAWIEFGTSPVLTNPNVTTARSIGASIIPIDFVEYMGGFVAGATYYYRAAASNSHGTGRGSIRSFSVGAPSSPSPMTATYQGGGAYAVLVSWSRVEGTAYYRVERRLSTGSDWTGFDYSGVGTVSILDYGADVQAPHTYVYRVLACNDLGCSPPSNLASVNTQALPAPSNVTATSAGSERVDVRWQDNSVDESGFLVRWRPVTDPNYTSRYDSRCPSNCLYVPPNTTSASVTRLQTGLQYFFIVEAIPDKGWRASVSNEVSAVPR